MRIDILTLFPETTGSVLHESIIGRACSKGLIDIRCVQIRDYTENKQKQVDDYPYGGGMGCVMMAQPLKSALDAVVTEDDENVRRRVIYMSPQGKPYDQNTAKRLASDYDHLVLVCGHYEGVDERFIEECVDEEISLGDFVLTGGEIAAMAVADSVCRLIPGVLSDESCFTEESHWNGMLEYPQYTRPEVWEGRRVPDVLLNGDHAKVDQWRHMQSIKRTKEKRPDLFEKLDLSSKEDQKLLKKLQKDEERIPLEGHTCFRKATNEDLETLRTLCARKYACTPSEETLQEWIRDGNCFVLTYDEAPAAYYAMTTDEKPFYDSITDGRWHFSGAYAVLEYIEVGDPYRGSGMAGLLMEHAAVAAEKMEKHSMRADVSKHNEPAKKLLGRYGYRFRGNLEDRGDRRQAFEKGLIVRN